jgi:guanylate kinase
MALTEQLKTKVMNYRVSPRALDPIRHAPIVLTCGITGAGKNAVLDLLLNKYPDLYHFIVSHTTRPMRKNEQQDVNYHFVDFATVEQIVNDGDFIETDVVHAEDVYGTSIAEIQRIEDAHQIACTDVTIRGADDYVALDLNVKAIFLLPPSYAVWKQRLLGRHESAGHMDAREIRNRLQSALQEIRHALDADYFYIVVNDDLEHTAKVVHKIATGEAVDRHFHKAVDIAEEIVTSIRAELAELTQNA